MEWTEGQKTLCEAMPGPTTKPRWRDLVLCIATLAISTKVTLTLPPALSGLDERIEIRCANFTTKVSLYW